MKKEEIIRQLQALPLDPSGPNFDTTRVSDLLDNWMKDVGSEDLSEEIYERVASGELTDDQGAWLLQVAAYTGNEGGASMYDTFRNWLIRSDDAIKVKLALSAEVVLFSSASEATKIYRQLAEQFPQFRERCLEKLSYQQ